MLLHGLKFVFVGQIVAVKFVDTDETILSSRAITPLERFKFYSVFIDTVPTHNKHIFVRPKKVCLFREMCLFWESFLINL